MAKKISFDVEVNPGGFDAGIRLIEAKAQAANGRMNRTVYEANKFGGLNRAQIQARADYSAKEEHRAQRKAEIDAARSAPIQGPDLAGTLRAKAAADEVVKYQEKLAKSSPGSFLNPRGSMTADQAAWAARLAAAKAQVEAHRNLQSQFSEPIPFRTGSGSHQFTRKDQMGGGRGFGVASSMFVSVARDSAASLASGAPLLQVMAQQGPQIMQAVTMIGGGIMKWGLGIGIAVAGLIGFHKATQWYFNLVASGFSDLERRGQFLEERGKKLRALREEQKADNEKAAAKAEADAKLLEDTVQTNDALGTTKAMIREAQAADDRARQQMIVDRLRLEEARAARQAAQSAPFEFIQGRTDLRKKAIDDQLAQAKATLERVQAEQQLKGMGQKTKVGFSVASDALTSVGNFLGAGRGVVNSIEQQQLDELKTQNRHLVSHGKTLTQIADKLTTTATEGGIEVPGS